LNSGKIFSPPVKARGNPGVNSQSVNVSAHENEDIMMKEALKYKNLNKEQNSLIP
jgi:hypothetical protein